MASPVQTSAVATTESYLAAQVTNASVIATSAASPASPTELTAVPPVSSPMVVPGPPGSAPLPGLFPIAGPNGTMFVSAVNSGAGPVIYSSQPLLMGQTSGVLVSSTGAEHIVTTTGSPMPQQQQQPVVFTQSPTMLQMPPSASVSGPTAEPNPYTFPYGVDFVPVGVSSSSAVSVPVYMMVQQVLVSETKGVDGEAIMPEAVSNNPPRQNQGQGQGQVQCQAQEHLHRPSGLTETTVTGDRRYRVPQVITSETECFYCRGHGHVVRSCPVLGSTECHFCHEKGHTRGACPALRGVKCWTCGGLGHTSSYCEVGPPRPKAQQNVRDEESRPTHSQ